MSRRRADPGQPTVGSTVLLIFAVLVGVPGGVVALIGDEQNTVRHASDPHLVDVVFGLSVLAGFLIMGGWGVWTVRTNNRLIRAARDPAGSARPARGRRGRAWIVTGALVAALILVGILGGHAALAGYLRGLFIGAAVLCELGLFWAIGKRLTRKRGGSAS